MLDVAGPRHQEDAGADALELVRRLFPICRSLTGDGVRETFDVLEEHIPLVRREIASGTKVFDWFVPDEWNIREAHITAPDGTRVVDFQRLNLHVVGYSEPVRATMPLETLQRAAAYAARSARPDPVPNVLLPPHVGILPLPSSARGAGAR